MPAEETLMSNGTASGSENAPGFEKHPDYQVNINASDRHVRVLVGDCVIADTRSALEVRESKHHPVWYLPLADVNTDFLTATETSTYCPFKGHASYWSIRTPHEELTDAVWSYQSPYRECLALQDYVGFYTNKVVMEIDGAREGADGPA